MASENEEGEKLTLRHGRPRQKIVNEKQKARHGSKIVGLGVILHVSGTITVVIHTLQKVLTSPGPSM